MSWLHRGAPATFVREMRRRGVSLVLLLRAMHSADAQHDRHIETRSQTLRYLT